MTYVLDACALLAMFKSEKGAEKIEALIAEALAGEAAIYMNTINLVKVNYYFYRKLGIDKSTLILEQIYTFLINFINTIDNIIFSETSRLKAQYSIPLGDAIGLATAIKMNATFVTADHSDFEEIEKKETLSFFWFR